MLRNGLIHLGESAFAKKVVTGTPLRAMSKRFVPGETVEELMVAIREANRAGMSVTANYLGEAEKSEATARAAAETLKEVMDRMAAEGVDGGISMKFTQLGQAISDAFLAESLRPLLERSRDDHLFVRFDMESSEYTQRTLDAFESVWAEGWRNVGVVVQSYLHRTLDDVRRLNELGARVRLCKGAYAEPPEVAFQEREEVDRSFVDLMKMLLSEGTDPAIATHDERMIKATIRFAKERGLAKDTFEFQMLHGVRRDLQQELVERGYRVRVYIPFGEAWYPYLMRRLAERPANVAFFAGSVIRESPLGFLWPHGPHRDGE
jgi:proline dehydrogenase